MKHLRILALSLLFAVMAPAALAGGTDENGGVIILHADYHFFWGLTSDCATLVVVATDRELRSLHLTLAEQEDALGVVRVQELSDDVAFDAAVQPLSDGRLVGRLVANGRTVMVVSRTYASRYFAE